MDDLCRPSVQPTNCQSGLDAVVGDQVRWIGVGERDAGGGDLVACVDSGRDFEVEGEELGEKVHLGAEAVGVEDGGIECGVGVFQRVFAGEFEGVAIVRR